jgi:hypothetical protein
MVQPEENQQNNRSQYIGDIPSLLFSKSKWRIDEFVFKAKNNFLAPASVISLPGSFKAVRKFK